MGAPAAQPSNGTRPLKSKTTCAADQYNASGLSKYKQPNVPQGNRYGKSVRNSHNRRFECECRRSSGCRLPRVTVPHGKSGFGKSGQLGHRRHILRRARSHLPYRGVRSPRALRQCTEAVWSFAEEDDRVDEAREQKREIRSSKLFSPTVYFGHDHGRQITPASESGIKACTRRLRLWKVRTRCDKQRQIRRGKAS